MTSLRNASLIFCLCFLLIACGGRSLLTSDLSDTEEFEMIIGQKLMLMPGDNVWFLMRDPYDPVTNFSKGYELTLLTTEYATGIMSGNIKPPLTPNGYYEILGIVNGSQIQVERVYEYGMETVMPVALGVIELSDGRQYPFESEWRSNFESQIAR